MFNGATVLKYKPPKRKKKKTIKRSGIICTCGALEKFFTTLHYIHDKDCVINKEN